VLVIELDDVLFFLLGIGDCIRRRCSQYRKSQVTLAGLEFKVFDDCRQLLLLIPGDF
jgi:hypothetical protein